MTVTNNIVLIGAANNAKPSVGANSLALNAHLKPIDYAGMAGGIYQISTVAYNNGSQDFNDPSYQYGFRWVSKSSVARIKFIELVAGSNANQTTFSAKLWRLTDFTQQFNTSDGGTTACTVDPISRQFLRGNMSSTGFNPGVRDFALGGLIADIAHNNSTPSNSALSGQVARFDPQPISSVMTSVRGVTIDKLLPPTRLFDATQWGDCPLVLTSYMGVAISLDSSAAMSTTTVTVTLKFEEIPIFAHEEFI